MNIFNLTALRLGLVCSYFLVTLLALLFILFLTITRHPVDDRVEDIIILKARNLPMVTLTSSTGF
jgi:hypothetical protein